VDCVENVDGDQEQGNQHSLLEGGRPKSKIKEVKSPYIMTFLTTILPGTGSGLTKNDTQDTQTNKAQGP
jgi:hypothetical protein